MFQLGVDRLLEAGAGNQWMNELKGRRVALLAHPASMYCFQPFDTFA